MNLKSEEQMIKEAEEIFDCPNEPESYMVIPDGKVKLR